MLAALLLAAVAQPSPAVLAALARAPAGTRIGLFAVDDTGREVAAMRADERFVPASTAKLYTTAAAFALLETGVPDPVGGAAVRLEPRRRPPDVVLVGHGDARLSSAADCTVDCLRDLARAVAARTRTVGDVVGDDSAFPDERWPPGMSWNNMAARFGTAVSALTLDDNETVLIVTPARIGAPATVAGDGYLTIDNRTITIPAGPPADIGVARLPGSDVLRVSGTVPVGAPPRTIRAGIDDPAHRAAWRLAALLRAEGVRVAGSIGVRHRVPAPADDPAVRGAAPPPRPPAAPVLARSTPPPLADDIVATTRASQNLHAELLLRRVGAVRGSGSTADGRAAVRALLDTAGVPRGSYDLSDGSGMSSYDRVTPRATVTLLRWGATQRWGAMWRAGLPVAGVDGTLARRFRGTALEGKLFAKTGSLNAADALAGYLVAASGRTLTFAIYAADMPDGGDARDAIDGALLALAAGR